MLTLLLAVRACPLQPNCADFPWQVTGSGAKRRQCETGAAAQPDGRVHSQVQKLKQSATPIHVLPQKRLQTPHTPPTACVVEVLVILYRAAPCVPCVVAWQCTQCEMLPAGDHCAALHHCQREYWNHAGHTHGTWLCVAGVLRCTSNRLLLSKTCCAQVCQTINLCGERHHAEQAPMLRRVPRCVVEELPKVPACRPRAQTGTITTASSSLISLSSLSSRQTGATTCCCRTNDQVLVAVLVNETHEVFGSGDAPASRRQSARNVKRSERHRVRQ